MKRKQPKLRPYSFRITPTNEGQDMNYSEVFTCHALNKEVAKEKANIRENEIISGLMELLPTGSFDCEVETI